MLMSCEERCNLSTGVTPPNPGLLFGHVAMFAESLHLFIILRDRPPVSSFLLVYFPNPTTTEPGRLKLRASHSLHVSQVDKWTHVLDLSMEASQGHVSRRLELGVELSLKVRPPDMGYGDPYW